MTYIFIITFYIIISTTANYKIISFGDLALLIPKE